MSLLGHIIGIIIAIFALIYGWGLIKFAMDVADDDEPIFKTDIKITIKKQNDDESDKQI